MRIRTLIATEDTGYTEHISEYISEHHADTMEISVCNSALQLQKILDSKKFDVALMDNILIRNADMSNVNLPLLLWTNTVGTDIPSATRCIRKHRRISSTVADILEEYSALAKNLNISAEPMCNITAVWSPAGGVGKTAVALAYAASLAAEGREVLYLNLETFSAASVHFSEQGKSISSVFEMLEDNSGNVKMLIQGIRACENGIRYLGIPENFDDICILSPENVRTLLSCCAETTNELIVDLSCTCDSRTRQVLELSDKVLLVTSPADTSAAKLSQFVTQSDVYDGIKEKTTLIVNKTSKDNDNSITDVSAVSLPDSSFGHIVYMPYIPAVDAQFVYKALAKNTF